MQQLNILPVNVSQNLESKDATSTFDSLLSTDDFSQYIDQHLNKSKVSKEDDKVDGVKLEAKVVKNDESAILTNIDSDKSDELVESNGINEKRAVEPHMQEVAASGNNDQTKPIEQDKAELAESEQLMSFLSKVDNALINQPTNSSVITSAEQLSAQQKAHYEAQLLLKSSELVADLSAVAKALGNEKVSEIVARIPPEKALSEEELFLKSSTKEAAVVKLPVDINIGSENKTQAPVINTEDFVALPDTEDELPENKIDSIVKAKFTSTSNNEINITQRNLHSSEPLEQVIQDEIVVKTDESDSLTAEQKLAKQVKLDLAQEKTDKANRELLNKELLNKEIVNSEQTKTINNTQTEEEAKLNPISQLSSKEQAKLDSAQPSVKAIDMTVKQVSLTQVNQYEKDSGLLEPQVAKNEVTQINESVNNKKIIEAKNQLISNDDEVIKTQAKQDDKEKLESLFVEQNQLKKVAEMSDAEKSENKTNTNGKISHLANGHFIDVSGKATQATQHIIEQQSAEVLNPSVASEVSQGQKTNTQLHHETISIFRKDFTEAVKDKVMLMISQKLQQFDITLDPPELGNMQVRVNLQGEQAVVNFLVQSQQTKDALEQNMQKLRDLLSQQGVDVGDANVEQQSNRSANENGSSDGNHEQTGNQLNSLAEENDVVAHTLSAKVLDSATTRIDYYA